MGEPDARYGCADAGKLYCARGHRRVRCGWSCWALPTCCVMKDWLQEIPMQTKNSKFWIGTLAAIYLAVLPMAGTIALRNVALFALTSLLFWHFLRRKPQVSWEAIKWAIPIFAWAAYLCAFPLIAEFHVEALRSFWEIWRRGLMAIALGAAVAVVLSSDRQRGSAFQLGLITTIPLLVHLALVGWKVVETSAIPWNYWGRESHHADLGYAAGHAVVLLSASLLAGRNARPVWAIALIAASILSVIIAHSRGGVGFGLLGLVFVFSTYFLVSGGGRRFRLLLGLVGVGLLTIVALGFAAKNDARWIRMADRLGAGFHGDALQIECEGTQQVEAELAEKYGQGERTRDLVASIQNGDGARTVLLRAGVRLAIEHPWGLDGSRQAYERRLQEHCPSPAILMSHLHNGWLDMVLALGWIGAVLYAWVLISFLRIGWGSLRTSGVVNEWALVLVALSLFWMFRGFTDSVFRDHQLEMQGFVLAYAATALMLARRSVEGADLNPADDEPRSRLP